MNQVTLASLGDAPPLMTDEPWADEFRESVSRVLAEHCGSLAVHAYIDGKLSLDQTVWRQAADLGWLGAALPEEVGGLGLGVQALQILHIEFGRRAAPGAFLPTLSFGQWLAEAWPRDLCVELLPAMVAGNLRAAIPALFSGPGVDLRDGSLRGEVEVIGPPDADIVAIPTRSAGGEPGWSLVRPDSTRAVMTLHDSWDRTRALSRLTCMDAEPMAQLRDPDGAIADRLRRHLSIAVAADSVGGASNIAHQTIEYLKTRVQFERPIASFQAIKHRAADLIASIATQERLLDQAVEAARYDLLDADMWAAFAKAGATEAFAFVSGDCIQLHGGVGHTWEFDPHIFAKRARLNEALVANNRIIRDYAGAGLARATQAGRITTELGL